MTLPFPPGCLSAITLVELGGISKGYIGSGIVKYLKASGVNTAIVNLGGNVIVMGTSPSNEEGWNVGVQDPDEVRGAVVGTVRTKDYAVITSGVYVTKHVPSHNASDCNHMQPQLCIH